MQLEVLAALVVDDLVVAELYCRNAGCPVREVTIRIKDYNNQITEHTKPLQCPVCESHLAVHWAMTFAEHEIWKEREAVMSVNLQRYRRDHDVGDGPLPMSAMVDRTLPR